MHHFSPCDGEPSCEMMLRLTLGRKGLTGMIKAIGFCVLLFCCAAAARAQPAIKLGVLTDLSGVYSDSTGSGSVEATRMAVEDCLAADCNGMQINVIVADHQNKPDLALSIAREWIDTQGVDALVDMSNAAIQLAIAPFVAQKNKVALFAGGTARLSGDACQPEHIVQWMWDTYAQVAGVARRLTKPGTTWYLVAADYAFGAQFELDARAIVAASGGRVAGSVRHPFPSSDMSSFLLQAQASNADIIALANAGADTVNAIKTAGGVWHRARPAAPRRVLPHRDRRERPRSRRGGRNNPGQRILLGPRRRRPSLLKALPCTARRDADANPGRTVFSDPALPEGCRRREERRRGDGRAHDASPADQGRCRPPC